MMGIELTNVRVLTKEQHEIEILKNRAEQYRQLVLSQETEIVRLQHKLKRMRKERKKLVSDIEGYVKVANEYAAENHSLIRQLESATRKSGANRELVPQKTSIGTVTVTLDASEAIKAIEKAADQLGAARSIPHHGPGLSEAEDTMRDTE